MAYRRAVRRGRRPRPRYEWCRDIGTVTGASVLSTVYYVDLLWGARNPPATATTQIQSEDPSPRAAVEGALMEQMEVHDTRVRRVRVNLSVSMPWTNGLYPQHPYFNVGIQMSATTGSRVGSQLNPNAPGDPSSAYYANHDNWLWWDMATPDWTVVAFQSGTTSVTSEIQLSGNYTIDTKVQRRLRTRGDTLVLVLLLPYANSAALFSSSVLLQQ